MGLVRLSGFKKRRVELAEQRDRKAAEKLQPIHSGGGKRTKKCKKVVKGGLSFAGEGDGDDGTDNGGYSSSTDATRANSEDNN